MLPMFRLTQRILFMFRSPEETPPPFPGAFNNWNTSDEFLGGAETAYRGILGGLLLGEPSLEELRPSLSPEIFRQLRTSREAPIATSSVDLVSVRLVSLGGPQSLQAIREGKPPWAYANDPEVREVFVKDMLHGSDLDLEVAAVAQVRCAETGSRFWRLDWVTLRSQFSLTDGIRESFRVVGFEEVAVVPASKEPAKEDESE
mmetsp:Transcript_24609/g.39439  ORF Transcript_24609/g.39439 Transcript_24609/m.39439 type:complete len:202 (-) Transcript_24609:8-613(-)